MVVLTGKDCENGLESNKILLKSKERFRSDLHNAFTEMLTKFPLVQMVIGEYRLLME